jgi:hypothetical protein
VDEGAEAPFCLHPDLPGALPTLASEEAVGGQLSCTGGGKLCSSLHAVAAKQRSVRLALSTRETPAGPPACCLQVAGLAEGYAGADLQALCTAAVMAAARRAAPALIELAEEEAAAGGAAAVTGPLPQGLPSGTGQVLAPAGQGGGGGGARFGVGQPAEGQPAEGQPAVGQPPQQQQQQGQALQQPPPQQPVQPQQQGREGQGALQQLLASVHVEPHDWWEALAAAPAPCSRRHGLAALSAGAARPLPPRLLPLLGPALRRALSVLHASGLPLPPAAATAAAAAVTAVAACAAAPEALPSGAGGGAAAAAPGCEGGHGGAAGLGAGAQQRSASAGGSGQFEALLCRLGAVLPSGAQAASDSSSCLGQPSSAPAGAQLPPALQGLPAQEVPLPHQPSSQQWPGVGGQGARACFVPCRVVLAGEGEMGQEQAAGAILKLLEGGVLSHMLLCGYRQGQ